MKTKAMIICLMLPLMAQAQELRLLPHITNPDGPFETTFIFENLTDEAVVLEVRGWGPRGYPQPFQLELLEPGEIREFEQLHFQVHYEDTFTNEPYHDTHFLIGGVTTDSAGIQASVSYQLRNGNGSPVVIREMNQSATRWRLFAGDWNKVFDALAIVNVSEETANLSIQQVAYDGSIIATLPIAGEVPPKGQARYVLGDPNTQRFDRQQSPVFEVVADQQIVVLALQGDMPGSQYLWQNATTPLN